MSKNKSLKKNFILNALLTLSGIIFPIVSFPYVSFYLGPKGTGKVSFAVSIINYFLIFAQLGIPTYGIRMVAQHRDNKMELSKTVWELFSINLFMTVLAYIVFIPTLFLVPKLAAEKTLFIVVSSTLFFNALGMEYLYRGLEEYSYITIRSVLFKVIAFAAMFILINSEDDYVIYGAITVFACAFSGILNFIHARHLISFNCRTVLDLRKHLKPVILFFAMSCATTVYLNLDNAMLGFMTTDEDVGYYGAAVKVKTVLVAVVTSLGAVLLPRASYYIETKQIDAFKRITNKAVKFVYVISIPLVVFFTLFARESILFLSGIDYLPAVPAMQVILPTVFFIGVTNIMGIQILVPLGKERYVLYSEIVGAIVDLIINLLLIPKYKAIGAALGTCVAEAAVYGTQYFFLYRMRKEISIVNTINSIRIWKVVLAIAIACPLSLIARFFKFPFVSSLIGRSELASRMDYFMRLGVAALMFFIPYYLIMMLAKDEMMIEISKSVFGKFKGKRSVKTQ